MNVFVIAVLAAFLLTGCDNFQLLKPVTPKKLPQLTIEQKDNVPTVTTLPQAGDGNTQTAPQIETKPANPENANQLPPKQSPAPAPAVNQTATVSTAPVAQPEAAPTITPEPSEPADAAALALRSGAPAPAPAPAPAAAPAPAPAATPAPAPAQTEKAKATSAEGDTAAKGSGEQKPEAKDDVKAEKKEEKPANPAAAAASAPAPAASSAKASDAPHIVTVVEYMNLATLLNKTFGDEVSKVVMQPKLPANTQRTDMKVGFSGNHDKFTYRISNKEKLLAEFKDVKINISGLNSFSSNGYEMVGICSGAKCEIIFAAISKFDPKEGLVENYPLVIKLVKDQYVAAGFKKGEEYSADRNALPDQNKISLVPQLEVSQKLQEHLDAHIAQLVDQLKKQLASDETLAYSDLVLGRSTLRGEKFSPQFSKENGKLVVTGELEFTGPKKPLTFKTEVKNDSASEISKTDIGLSLIVIPRVKDQIYVVMMEQEKYTSKIPKVDRAAQAFVCAVMEAEKNQFSDCLLIPASLIFGEGVVEGNAKATVKEAAKEAGK